MSDSIHRRETVRACASVVARTYSRSSTYTKKSSCALLQGTRGRTAVAVVLPSYLYCLQGHCCYITIISIGNLHNVGFDRSFDHDGLFELDFDRSLTQSFSIAIVKNAYLYDYFLKKNRNNPSILNPPCLRSTLNSI